MEKGFAYEFISDYKKDKKRLFIIIIILLAMLAGCFIYIAYLLNDIGSYEERIQEIDTSGIEYSDIINGDYYGED